MDVGCRTVGFGIRDSGIFFFFYEEETSLVIYINPFYFISQFSKRTEMKTFSMFLGGKC